jgi:hypothetical protein
MWSILIPFLLDEMRDKLTTRLIAYRGLQPIHQTRFLYLQQIMKSEIKIWFSSLFFFRILLRCWITMKEALWVKCNINHIRKTFFFRFYFLNQLIDQISTNLSDDLSIHLSISSSMFLYTCPCVYHFNSIQFIYVLT